MDIKPIKTDEDYQAALAEIDRLFDAVPDTPEGDRLEVLITLVEAYESKHFSMPLPDPIEAIEYHMESRGLTRRDLEPYIGSRARVSEILNHRRSLTLRMIRNLEAGLGIPAGILIQRYNLIPAQVETEPEMSVRYQKDAPVTEEEFIRAVEPLPIESQDEYKLVGWDPNKWRFYYVDSSTRALNTLH